MLVEWKALEKDVLKCDIISLALAYLLLSIESKAELLME